MSIRLMAWAKNQRVGDVAAKSVLLFIAERANDAGTCWPSLNTLSDETEIPRRTLQRKIAILIERGLLTIEERRRVNTDGGRTSNLYRLNASAEWLRESGEQDEAPPCQSGAGYAPPDGAPPAPIDGATKEPSPNQETSDEVSPRLREIEDGFDRFWKVYPRKDDRRAALKVFERVLRKREASVDELVRGAERYAVEVRRRSLEMVKLPTTWLQRECWRTDQSERPAEAPPPHGLPRTGFAGPPELRSALAASRGEAWACSWVDPCGWDPEARQLIPRTGFAGDRIRQDAGRVLREAGVSIGQPQRERA